MILDLSEATDAERVGGKAAGLAVLQAAGERVPPGFVVPADRVADLRVEDLAGALAVLGCARVAVRSSGRHEDGSVRSRAGAHLTRLDVPSSAPAVLAAVREVATSGADVSVLVQAMVPAAAAGVAFSVDPVTGDAGVLVTAVPGTGERLVAGEVAGETWRVTDAGAAGPPGADAVLTAAQAEEVAAAVRRLRATRGHHVDVEFALEQGAGPDGRLVLLQCRPVTVVPVPPDFIVPPGTWEKDVAHSPGPLSPLMISLDEHEDLFADWAERFGLVVSGLRMETFGGEEYSQVVPLLGSPESSGAPPPAWVLGALARVVPALRRRMRTARRVVDGGLLEELQRRWEAEGRAEMLRANERFRLADRTAMTDAELVTHVDAALEHVRRGLVVHFDLFIPYLVGVHGFVRAAERHLGWDAAQAVQALAGWSPASAVAGDRLRALGSRLRAVPDAVAVVDRSADVDGVVAGLESLDAELAADLAAWLAEEGFRLTDYDVAAPSLAEVPGVLLGLLREAVSVADERPALRARERARVEQAAAALQTRGRDEVLASHERACAVFGLREDNVRVTGLGPLAAVRFAVLEMGRRVSARGRLTDPGEVMMLTLGELRAALAADPREPGEGKPPDLDAVTARRRGEQAWVRTHPGPPCHGPEPAPPPDLRALPRAGRRINAALIWAMGQELSPPTTTDPGHGALVAGTPCGPGRHTGVVRVVRDAGDFHRLRPGDVLVCPIATPAWAALFPLAGAVVCDGGGVLSHTAIIAREHGLPTVMGAGDATSRLVEGILVTVDGAAGTVTPA